ncbi:hypothetical protein [Nonomuraea dietziae]
MRASSVAVSSFTPSLRRQSTGAAATDTAGAALTQTITRAYAVG